VSVIVPARNEAGNIAEIFERTPEMGSKTELIFVEGHSTDATLNEIEAEMARNPNKLCRLFRQKETGKGDAVRTGFANARGDILIILDADLTVPPEVLPRFLEVLCSGKGEFANGVRLVYPMEKHAMRFFNLLGNKFFSVAFSDNQSRTRYAERRPCGSPTTNALPRIDITLAILIPLGTSTSFSVLQS